MISRGPLYIWNIQAFFLCNRNCNTVGQRSSRFYALNFTVRCIPPLKMICYFFSWKVNCFLLLFWWYNSHFCSDLATDFFTTFWLHQSDISLCIKMKNCSIWILAPKIRNSKYYLVTLSDRKKRTFENRNFFTMNFKHCVKCLASNFFARLKQF